MQLTKSKSLLDCRNPMVMPVDRILASACRVRKDLTYLNCVRQRRWYVTRPSPIFHVLVRATALRDSVFFLMRSGQYAKATSTQHAHKAAGPILLLPHAYSECPVADSERLNYRRQHLPRYASWP